ncbi:MAG TPA: hypothetical protein VFZ25_08950 [Chloroflexota bacterium]|nr:hypothetical protein [Chloroflexota bacterium]
MRLGKAIHPTPAAAARGRSPDGTRPHEVLAVEDAFRDKGSREARVVDNLPAETDPARLGEIFLRRLKRALLLRFYTESLLSPGDRRLLDRVIYSTYYDCRQLGVVSDARRLLQEARSGVGLFQRPLSAAGKRRWSI